MAIGIVGYGAYIPLHRIKVETIAAAHTHDVQRITRGLRLAEKSVPAPDEDAATLAVAAAQNALSCVDLNPKNIGALYVGSESHPYAVKPTATLVASALSLSEQLMAADLEFACKGGTAAIQLCYSLVASSMTSYALGIGTDTAQSEPGDILEYSAAAGAAAFVLGCDEQEIIATIDATVSITTNTPDFWRRSLQKYPQHTNRFTGEPSYFSHTIRATTTILNQTGLKAADFDYVVFHQPNGKFPRIAAKRLGFTSEQLAPGLVVDEIGNAYSACSLLGLCAVLDVAQSGQKILLVSYGSGSGSDAFVLTTTEPLLQAQKNAPSVQAYIDRKKYITYQSYRSMI